ncbi:hypothetical protein DXG01_010269 [Tephrocybe rancida]|nr:hypothetical protein DXG01_010269 [Tephrocybe rancida]
MTSEEPALRTTPTPLPEAQLVEEAPIELMLSPKTYVWLVPAYTTKVSEALTIYDVTIQSRSDPGYSDLAAGAGDKYRYLIPVTQTGKDLFISELTLARSNKDLSANLADITWHDLPQDHTQDLNEGRGGTSYLYLAWQLQRAYKV